MALVLEKIISGGQTGVDQLALEVARSLSIPTGGTAPKGYLTETGRNTSLHEWYGLIEHTSSEYPPRTRSNVQQSDGTVLLGDILGGTKLTLEACKKEEKPHIINPTADGLRTWLIEHQIKVLNVAGNRGSKLNFERTQEYRQLLYDVFTYNQRLAVLFEREPNTWGLRGDPYLWKELKQVAQTLLLPDTESELRNLIVFLIQNLIGEELAAGKTIIVARYQFGGMSGGVISADYWHSEAIPLLLHRLQLIKNGYL